MWSGWAPGRLDAGLAANSNVTLQVIDVPAPANPPATTTLNFGMLKAGSTLPVTKTVQITNSGTGVGNAGHRGGHRNGRQRRHRHYR